MRSLALLVSASLVACGAEAPPPAETPRSAEDPAPAASQRADAGLPLWTVPNAEATPRYAPEPETHDPPRLRSDGKRHALERTNDGVVIVSEADGVIGVLRGPEGGPVAWAGFVDDDAVLVASRGVLFRASSPAEALAGHFARLGPLDAKATMMASAGTWVVAAAAAHDAPVLVSKDSGKTFAPVQRPAGPLLDLTVRVDGAIVIALEKERVVGEYNQRGVRADVQVRRGGNWTRGPLAEAYYGRLIDHYGDAVTVDARAKLEEPASLRVLGLGAGGAWTPASIDPEWPARTFTQDWLFTSPPVKRPGFVLKASDNLGGLGGIMGGSDCQGVACLGGRRIAATRLRIHAFLDGRCGPEAVKIKKDTIDDATVSGKPGHGIPRSYPVCDDAAPAKRGSALLLDAGDTSPRIGRLPVWCGEGRLVGSIGAVYAVCSGKHRGRPSIHYVERADGALVEVAAPVPPDLEVSGGETTSDKTTVLFGRPNAFLCRAAEPCTPIDNDRFLAARPLPGKRALVARGADGGQALDLRVEGGPASPAVRVTPSANVLDLEVTAEGHVRLWISASQKSLSPPAWLAKSPGTPDVDAFLVRADGKLAPDPDAKAALLRDIDAARRGR